MVAKKKEKLPLAFNRALRELMRIQRQTLQKYFFQLQNWLKSNKAKKINVGCQL